MMVNLSYLKANKPLAKNMYLTIEPDFVNTDIEFEQLHNIVSSDYIQYTPYSYYAGMKLPENWSNDKQALLIFDIDDGMTLSEASKTFSKYTNLITTTKNHLKDKKNKICDRFRVILPASNIPKGEIYFEMLEVMSKQIPMDIQVNHKTGAFLGNSNAINFYNVGEIYDCSYAIELAQELLVSKIKRNALKTVKQYKKVSVQPDDIKALKNSLNGSVIMDILNELGYEHRGNKFAIRKDERTPSAKVFPSGYIKDYGSGKSYDIFSFLYECHGMTFKHSLQFVERFMNGY